MYITKTASFLSLGIFFWQNYYVPVKCCLSRQLTGFCNKARILLPEKSAELPQGKATPLPLLPVGLANFRSLYSRPRLFSVNVGGATNKARFLSLTNVGKANG